jgi:hypothetical protein
MIAAPENILTVRHRSSTSFVSACFMFRALLRPHRLADRHVIASRAARNLKTRQGDLLEVDVRFVTMQRPRVAAMSLAPGPVARTTIGYGSGITSSPNLGTTRTPTSSDRRRFLSNRSRQLFFPTMPSPNFEFVAPIQRCERCKWRRSHPARIRRPEHDSQRRIRPHNARSAAGKGHQPGDR